MQATDKGIDVLNSLLRGELSATETYQLALKKLADDPGAEQLKQMHVDHRSTANLLRQHVHQHGGKPDQGSGVWGAWAKLVESTAKLLGNKAALKALKEGEEHGVKEYEEALQSDSLPADCKMLIETQLLPQTRSHISSLDQIMEKQ